MGDAADYSDGPSYGSGLGFGGTATPGQSADIPPAPAATPAPSFGQNLRNMLPGPNYRAPDPATSALDQTADTLQQRIERANSIATNPMAQFFSPEGVQKARDFVPQATEQLLKIRQQKAAIAAGRTQAETLGLALGEVPDEATQADRVTAAQAKALKGDLRVWKGLQAVDPKAAEAIQDRVFETAGGHLDKAQLAFDSLSATQNQGQYAGKLEQLRRDGTLTDLEALGVKVPPSFDVFGGVKASEGQALREARIGINTIRQKLEERNTYQPMEKKEAETYAGRMTTVAGDQITNGTWGRNASSGARGLVVNGAANPADLGKKFTFASPEQRKAIAEEVNQAVPKADLEKQRAFDRTYELATKVTTDGVYDDGKGGKVRLKKGDDFPAGAINTNPNVQQGIAEGLASMLRGGTGGANVGLLKIETGKRGVVQGVLDSLATAYAGGVNTLSQKEIMPYLTKLTQQQQRDVLDGIKQYNDATLEDRVGAIARRAGALGLGPSVFGFGKDDSQGAIANAIEEGRREQIARMSPNHQAIGGGDGVFQLGAQRSGADASNLPAGTAPTTQLLGAQPVATPVQQAQNPQPTSPVPSPAALPGGGGSPPPAAPASNAPPVPAGGGSPAAPTPTTIAGQTVNVPPLPPGASPDYLAKTQRIESGREKDPWKAGNDKSSAGGAWQFINSTWAADKPPGAPDKARDATPQQQAEAAATRATKNAVALAKAGVPVNDTNLYIAHNLGEGAGSKLLTADPAADARTVVGETAAKNNPLFFRGKPTVAKVLERYNAEMNPDAPKPLPGSGGGATAAAPGLMDRVRGNMSGVDDAETFSDANKANMTRNAAAAAPAALSTIGAVGGGLAGGPAGAVAGGAVGGGAGQSIRDYLLGNDQSPAAIAKEAALGGVLGIAPAGRPFLGAAARVVGAGGVEGGAKAIEGGDAGEVADAALKGSGAAATGELFGRALGMAGHKVFSMFAPDAQKAVRTAAKEFSDAEAVLAKEAPTLPGVGGAKGGPNPAYEAAEKAKERAETTLKDAGLKPEEAAYAHKISSEPETSRMDTREAQASKPGALEAERVGKGYQQLEGEVGAASVGAPKAAPKLADGPRSAVETGKVSTKHAELAERTEMAITAPAASWQEKWVQLKDTRSALLEAERDALNSTATGKSQTARDMRTLADTVRTQQEKAAKYVFGEKDGAAFMDRLKVLDVRYRRLMDAGGDDIVKAAALKGEAGRDADRKFRAFAHDDPQAIAAWDAMRQRGTNLEQGVHDLVAAERIPVLGKVFSALKLAGSFNRWLRERAAGSPATFESILNASADTSGKTVRDVTGSAGARAATM